MLKRELLKILKKKRIEIEKESREDLAKYGVVNTYYVFNGKIEVYDEIIELVEDWD